MGDFRGGEGMRGYFAIGIECPKRETNIGTLWRSAYAFGASFIFTIGERYVRQQASDTCRTWRHIPLLYYQDLQRFQDSLPKECPVVGIETVPSGRVLRAFTHPQRVIYLLGAEDRGLSKEAMAICSDFIRIPAAYCLNVATAGSIVMYDRSAKQDRFQAKGYSK